MFNRAALRIALVCLIMYGSAVPAFASEGIAAGFAPGPVWLSQSAPSAGSAVRLYTVVYDGSASAIEGSVSFTVDGTTIGSAPFSLNAGESSIESVSWVASEGSHSVSAEITSVIDKKTKTTINIGSTTTTTLSIVVGPTPPKPAALEAIDTAQGAIASSSPIIQSILKQTSAVTESVRTSAEAYLNSIASPATSTVSTTTRGSVLGAETVVSDSEPVTTHKGIGSQIATTLLPIFKYPALFYPVFIGLILLFVWILVNKLKNPNKRRR